MVRYETLILAIPEITKAEMEALETQVEQVVKKSKGSLISYERWGKYRLAYPIRDNEYGVYFLTRYEVDTTQAQTLVKDIDGFFAFKKADIVMRSMTTYLDPNQSLAYQKPESLEDSPSRDVDSFLRENKMEGLLSKEHSTPPSFQAEEDNDEEDTEQEDQE